ncbi:MAG: hypothetical protein HOP08_20135 [Cyclobacteriaceae bacterium]|nr:hypothetical protein [Cyclobacteriaceae bacterium]
MKASIWLLLIIIVVSCNSGREKTTSIPTDSIPALDTLQVIEIDTVKKDKSLDALAAYIAGISQRDSNVFTLFEKDPYWENFKSSTDSNWNRIDTERFSKMGEWQESNLNSKLNDSLKLFYPFSGPDFLHAYYLYPMVSEYILAALEPIQEVPRLDTLTTELRDRFFDSLAYSMKDVFRKSYFITLKMRKDIKNVKGVLPPLYFFIERTGHELLAQSFFYLDSTGTEISIPGSQLHSHKFPGVRLKFRNILTRQIKQLYYVNVDVSNDGLKENPQFQKFIARKGPYNTFIKSASYLLHKKPFTEIKKIIVENSLSLFQDDTGIPYKDFKNRLDWNLELFGDYETPVKGFADRFQRDLDSAYKTKISKTEIPFSIGYHWDTKKQNYMLVRKSEAIITK